MTSRNSLTGRRRLHHGPDPSEAEFAGKRQRDFPHFHPPILLVRNESRLGRIQEQPPVPHSSGGFEAGLAKLSILTQVENWYERDDRDMNIGLRTRSWSWRRLFSAHKTYRLHTGSWSWPWS